MPGSPAIDQGVAAPGVTTPTHDAEGVSRALTGGSAGVADLGAFEYHGDAGRPLPIVSPARLLLSQRQGGPPPDAIALSIRNASVQTLPWTATVAVESSVPWLVVRPPAAGELTDGTGTVSVVLDSAGLDAGEYRGTISVAVDSADAPLWAVDSPRVVEVLLTVNRNRTVCASGCDYIAIQPAVDAAIAGDDIVIMDGSYPGGIVTRGKSLTLRSANGRDATTIDCEGGGRGITVSIGDYRPTVVQGLTVRDCSGELFGGVRTGGGLWSSWLTYVVVLDSRFEDNILGRGTPTTPTTGGGMRVGYRAQIARTEFLHNDADRGGGLYMGEITTGVLGIDETTFHGNVATLGAGLYVDQAANGATIVLRSAFDANTSGGGRTDTPAGLGAYLGGASIGIEACWFTNNGYGAPAQGPGGGVFVTSDATAIVNSVFVNNRADAGGGLYGSGSNAGVANCTFYGNQASITTEDGGGGVYLTNASAVTVVNSVAVGNTDGYGASTAGNDIRSSGFTRVTYSGIGAGWSTANNNRIASAADFVNAGANDFRLVPTSGLIDAGTKINWLFSDARGSVRAIDGKNSVVPLGMIGTTDAKFDIGAFEYSRYYGGIGEDRLAPAFRNLRVNAPIVATGYEYRVQWETKDPFPEEMDERIAQAGEYEVRLLLMGKRNNRVVLGTWKMRLGPQYTIPYTFGPEHVGTWRVRLEMVSDIGQFVESDEVTIQYKDLVPYDIGKKIPPPADALPGLKPDADNEEAIYWSTETNELYAIAPNPVQLTWYGDKDRTVPILVMAMLKTPLDPQFHVVEAPPVDLLPEGTRFDSVTRMWSDSSANLSSNRFTAPQDGWTTLLFRDSQNADPARRELFTVVRTLTWNHDGSFPAQDPMYPPPPPNPPPLPPVDPDYPIEKTAVIGQLINDPEHDQTGACSGGHVIFEVAPYDGAGADRAYDRPTRSGQIIAVNDDDPNTAEDDLVVIWYRRQGSVEDGAPGVCWPFKPVRYDPAWPAPGATCPGNPAGNCNRIEIAGGLVGSTRTPVGSGALPPDTFGAWENMIVYDQPDRRLPGFNPNEEHAMLFVSQGTPYPGVFPLRSDLNRFASADWNAPVRFTSRPYTLLKHRDPVTGEWRFKTFLVEPGTLTYTPVAGGEFNPPYPLNQFVLGPCRDKLPETWNPTDPNAPHNGTWTDAVAYDGTNATPGHPQPAQVLVDKDSKIFFLRGSRPSQGDAKVEIRSYNFYRLQPGFWYDLDNNGWQDEPAGTCVPLLDGWDPDSQTYGAFDGKPAAITSDVGWPETPTLFVGETLADAKMQAGETVGLPNVKDQCIVAKLWDEAGVRLFDPTREWSAPLPGGLPEQIKIDPPTGTGSRVRFLDLPPQLQGRLTYDSTVEPPVLKLKGEYITTTGEPVLLLNTLSIREVNLIRATYQAKDNSGPFLAAVDALKALGDPNLAGKPSLARWEADFKALSAGNVDNTGFVVLAFNNHVDCPAPTMVSVIEVDCPLYRGDLKVVESPNPFEEKLTLRHNGDFGGNPDARWFEWVYLQGYSGIPEGPSPNNENGENWLPFNPANSATKPTPTAPGDAVVPGAGGGDAHLRAGIRRPDAGGHRPAAAPGPLVRCALPVPRLADLPPRPTVRPRCPDRRLHHGQSLDAAAAGRGVGQARDEEDQPLRPAREGLPQDRRRHRGEHDRAGRPRLRGGRCAQR